MISHFLNSVKGQIAMFLTLLGASSMAEGVSTSVSENIPLDSETIKALTQAIIAICAVINTIIIRKKSKRNSNG